MLSIAARSRRRVVNDVVPPPAAARVVDLTQLPVANRQLPRLAAYEALGVHDAPAGLNFPDPVTGVRTIKLTSRTFPEANNGMVQPVGAFGWQQSQPWVSASDGRTYRTVYVYNYTPGSGWFIDLDVTASDPADWTLIQASARRSPVGSDNKLSFSDKAGEETIVYYAQGTPPVLHRYDFVAMALAETGNYPHTFTGIASAAATIVSTFGSRIWLLSPSAVGNAYTQDLAWWDSETNTEKRFPQSNLATIPDANDGSQVRGKEGVLRRTDGRYVAIGFSPYMAQGTGYSFVVWDTTTGVCTGPITKGVHIDWVGDSLVGQDPDDAGQQWRYDPAPVVGISPAADPGTKTDILTAAQFSAGEQHRSGGWNQGALANLAWSQLYSDDGPSWMNGVLTSKGWTLDAGNVYTMTLTAFYAELTIGVLDVWQLDNSSPRVPSQLTKAASRAAMTEGTWFYDTVTHKVYAWAVGSINLAAAPIPTVTPIVPSKAYLGNVFVSNDGTALRLLNQHYSTVDASGSGAYPTQPHSGISADGQVVGFSSTMNRYGTLVTDAFLVAVPTRAA